MTEKEKVFLEEQEHLNKTLDAIEEGIGYYDRLFHTQENTIIGFKEGQRGTQFTRQAMMSLSATNSNRLKRIVNSPYFGRFDFKKKFGSEQPVYVGKTAVTDKDDNMLCYDWRSPICSLYYENGLGETSYQSPSGEITGDVTLRRQIKVEDSKLIEAYDTSGLSEDEFLIPFLSTSADSRLKNIVASIQSEQNAIIRKALDQNLIVQGVAGSGKTTVALHRIAYLTYLKNDKLKQNQFLIIGPNKYFMNYISEVLPDLDVEAISQNTFPDIVSDVVNGKVRIEDQTISLEKLLNKDLDGKNAKFKSSMEFKELLEIYLKEYFDNLFAEDVTYHGIPILKKERIKAFMGLEMDNPSAIYEKLNRLQKFTVKSIKENKSEINSMIWQQYRDEFKQLDKTDPRKKKILNEVEELQKEVDKGCPTVIKDYFKAKLVKPNEIYMKFMNWLSTQDIEGINTENLKNESIEYLKKGKVRYEDLGSLLYIGMLLYNTSEYKDVKHVVIDEAQDYGLFQFYMLKKLFSGATFSIFGDLNQSIYSYRGVEDWESVKKEVFDDNSSILNLNKSYRTTKEIVDISNSILELLECQEASPVLRHGPNTNFIEAKTKEINPKIIDKIKEYQEKGYKSIAVITKDEKEATKQWKELKKSGIDIRKISYKDTTYDGGLCIMPSYLSKGLEFDAVIISDGNQKTYDENSITDMKLLYVASTRPLHELEVIYNGDLNKAFDQYKNKDTKGKVKQLVK